MGRLDPHLSIHPDRPALMRALAAHIVDAAKAAIAARGRFTWALSGGATPRELYALLGQAPWAERLDWGKTHLFWGDERCVGPEDPASNYGMVREALLERVPIPAAQVHRMRGEDEPVRAAEAYEAELRACFRGGSLPDFDVLLLGLGPDGHTASLFPGGSALKEARRWVLAQAPAGAGPLRLTLTLPVLNAARQAHFLVAGADKAARLAQLLAANAAALTLPAQMIQPASGDLHIWADASAAAELERT